MSKTADIHPKILQMRSRLAHLINLVQPTYHAEDKALGELYRVAVDNGIDVQVDKELGDLHEQFCDYHEHYDIDALTSPEDALEKVCPPLAQWLAEGMSPVVHFASSDNYSVGKSLFYDVYRSEHFNFSAEQLLGSLSLDEFCGYFAIYLELKMAGLPRLRKIVAVLPEMLNPVCWHTFNPRRQSEVAAGSSTVALNDEINQWLPLLILDYTKNEALYKQATAFFNPRPTIHLFKKLFGDGDTPQDMNLIDKVVSLSFGGWGGETMRGVMPSLLRPLPFVVIRPQDDEVRNENVDYLNFMIDKALAAIQENSRVFWPVCLLTDILLKNCGGLHASSSPQEKQTKLKRLLKQHPTLDGIIDHLRKIPAQHLNFEDIDIYNVQNQSIFIDLLTPAQKTEWVPSQARKLAQSFKHSMQRGGWTHSLEKSKLMFKHIHEELQIGFSEELRAIVKNPSAYVEWKQDEKTLEKAKVIVWLQTLSLQGPESAARALIFCHSLQDPVLTVAAAMELGIDPITLNASGEEAALYLESDLGL